MLNDQERRVVAANLLAEVHRHPYGVDTRVLVAHVLQGLTATIPSLNFHHVWGSFSRLSRGLTWTMRNPGGPSIIRA